MAAEFRNLNQKQRNELRAQGHNVPEFVEIKKTSKLTQQQKIDCIRYLMPFKKNLLSKVENANTAIVLAMWREVAPNCKDTTLLPALLEFIDPSSDFATALENLAHPAIKEEGVRMILSFLEKEQASSNPKRVWTDFKKELEAKGSRPATKEEIRRNKVLAPGGSLG